MTTIVMELTRLARKSGGDRYEALPGQPCPELIIYLPQEISRPGNVPLQRIEVTIQPWED